MNNFWENISRYPRFFISSFTGLIIIILTPFKGFFKTSKLRFVFLIFMISSLLTLYITIKNMLAI
jgi:hypothetical protein